MFTKMGIAETQRVNTVAEDWRGDEFISRPQPEEIERLIDSALGFAAKRSKREISKVEAQIRAGDLWANSTLRYALAREIAAMLRGNAKFRGLYVTGSVLDDQARLTSDIDIILHVVDDKQNFESWIELLDEALVESFRARFGLGEGFRTLLDSHVVTDEEVSRRAGYGVMLSSIHANVAQV